MCYHFQLRLELATQNQSRKEKGEEFHRTTHKGSRVYKTISPELAGSAAGRVAFPPPHPWCFCARECLLPFPLLWNVNVQTPGERPWAIWRQDLPRRAGGSQVLTFCLHSFCASQKEEDWLPGSHKAEWSGTRIPDLGTLPPLGYIISNIIFRKKLTLSLGTIGKCMW